MIMAIFLYLFFSGLYGGNDGIADNLLVTNSFIVNDRAFFNQGLRNTFGDITFKGNIIINSDNINIGNNKNNNTIVIRGLPIGSPNITLPLKYLMVGENSNEIYIGTVSSPLPPPDYLSVDNLVSNTIIANRNTKKLTFNNNYNSDIIIGNKNANTILSANTIYFNNNQLTQKSTFQDTSLLNYICPVTFEDSVSFNTITIGRFLNCTNTKPITIIAKSINYNTLNLSNTVVIGSNDLLSSIEFHGLFTGNSNNVTLGSPDCAITQIENLPVITNNKNFLYYLNDIDTNFIYTNDLMGFNTTINVFYTDSVEVNFINNTNTANTLFQSKNFILLSSNIINSDLQISNTIFENKVYFDTINVEQDIPFYFVAEENINITNNSPITINNAIFNNVFFFSKTNISNNLQPTTTNIDYLSVNTQGKVCIYPVAKNLAKIQNDIISCQDIANTIENSSIIIQDRIKKNKKINILIKKIIALLRIND
jgi:hypothetical protein